MVYRIPLISPTSEPGDNISANFVWHKFINFIISLASGELFKEIAHIPVRLKSIALCCLYYAVKSASESAPPGLPENSQFLRPTTKSTLDTV
jgi:hypothetical protein